MKYAIITGGTSGLGLSYAKCLAEKGWHLLITGRNEIRLLTTKISLQQRYNISVSAHKVDFNNENEFNSFIDTINKLSCVDMLINNAGFGCRSGFVRENFSEHEKMLQVYITAYTRLIHTIVPKMTNRGSGSVINVSSLCAFLPSPLNYFYCSSKAFIITFSECLHVDLRSKGIKVQVLCPGFIKTNFHKRIGCEAEKCKWYEHFLWMDASQVAKLSLNSLKKSGVVVIPGIINKLIYLLSVIMPRKMYYRIVTNRVQKLSQPTLVSKKGYGDLKVACV